MLGTTKRRALTTAGAVAGVVIVFGATASASIPSSSGTIYGCYAKTNGATRIIDPAKQKCSGTENPISWNQRGPTGPRGPQGLKGDIGTAGAPGISGYELVTHTYADQGLPIDDSFNLPCPTGKHVLGGGAIVQIYTTSGFQGLNTPEYSMPWDSGNGWLIWVKQPSVGAGSTINVSLSITCAVTGP